MLDSALKEEEGVTRETDQPKVLETASRAADWLHAAASWTIMEGEG